VNRSELLFGVCSPRLGTTQVGNPRLEQAVHQRGLRLRVFPVVDATPFVVCQTRLLQHLFGIGKAYPLSAHPLQQCSGRFRLSLFAF
jgi:hypothetical protein